MVISFKYREDELKKKFVSHIIVNLLIGFVIGFPNMSFTGNKRGEVRKRVQEYEDAYNRGDAEAVASIYDVNASHTLRMELLNRGRLEIQKGLEEMLAGPMKGTQMKLTPEVIRFPADNVAVERHHLF